MMLSYDINNSLIMVSDRGENHIAIGAPNQDKISFERTKDGFAMVLADGVSSAEHAELGAAAAVETITELASKTDMFSDRDMAPDYIKTAIVKNWKKHFESDWDEYATTLNFVVKSQGEIWIGQIGDGLIVYDVDGEHVLMTSDEDFFSTETYALGAAVLKKTFTIVHYSNPIKFRIAMMSDGIGKEIDTSKHIDFAESLFEMAGKPESEVISEFEAWITNLNTKNGDDKTIGIYLWEAQ